MPKGVKLDRLPAVATCAERGYTVGTVLVSSAWNEPKELKKIRAHDVIVGPDRVKSFPPDVRRAP